MKFYMVAFLALLTLFLARCTEDGPATNKKAPTNQPASDSTDAVENQGTGRAVADFDTKKAASREAVGHIKRESAKSCTEFYLPSKKGYEYSKKDPSVDAVDDEACPSENWVFGCDRFDENRILVSSTLYYEGSSPAEVSSKEYCKQATKMSAESGQTFVVRYPDSRSSASGANKAAETARPPSSSSSTGNEEVFGYCSGESNPLGYCFEYYYEEPSFVENCPDWRPRQKCPRTNALGSCNYVYKSDGRLMAKLVADRNGAWRVINASMGDLCDGIASIAPESVNQPDEVVIEIEEF